MQSFSSNKQSGQVSRTLIILGLVLVMAAVLVFFGIRYATTQRTSPTTTTNQNQVTAPPPAVYEAQIGDIKFTVQSAKDLGSVLPTQSLSGQDVVTTEKFILVTIGAQNKGKNDTIAYSWDLGNVIDIDGRNFLSADNKAYFYMQQFKNNMCGAVLKPDFAPLNCLRIYEVAKSSTQLGIQIKGTNSKNKATIQMLDLNVTK